MARTLSLLLLALALGALPARTAAAEDKKEGGDGEPTVLEQRVQRAVDRALVWLRKHQNPAGKGKEGAWSFREPYWESGVTALTLFALLRAGVDRDDPMVQAGFRYLVKNVPAGGRETEMYTYNVSTQMLAIEAGYGEMLRKRAPQNALEKGLLALFEADFRYFDQALKEGEAGYTIDQQGLDLSNTQFAVMALEAARRAGFASPLERWYAILAKCMALQAEDGPTVHRVNILSRKGDEVDRHGYIIRDRYGWITGKPAKARGWTYGEFFKKDEIYGSMTCAGLANLLSCSQVLEKEKRFQQEFRKDFEVAVRDGFAWLQKYYAVNANPAEPSFWSMGRLYEGDTFWTYYYLFTLARITTSTNIRFIGNRNWYEEGCNFLLRAQRPEGCWDQVAHETHNFKSDCIPLVNTAFALWFFSSLDHSRIGDPEAEARAARESGKPHENEGAFVRRLEKLLLDAYRPRKHWDVDSPLDGTAELLYGYALHPIFEAAREEGKVKAATLHITSSLLAGSPAMDVALKQVKAPTTMDEYYEKHLLYERWRTATLSRMIRALLGLAMGESDWERLEKARPGSRPSVASGARKPVALLVKQIVAHARKTGRGQVGWTQSCGRPTILVADADSTARALRALDAAAWCGLRQPSTLWKAAGRFLLACQEESGPEVVLRKPDGTEGEEKARARGFGVLPGDPAGLALTFDCLSALHLVLEHGKPSGSDRKKLEAALRDGLAWIQVHFQGFSDFGLLVSVKRLGRLLGRDCFGTLDWRKEGRKFLGYQDQERGYLAPDASRRIGFTFFFLSPRFLS